MIKKSIFTFALLALMASVSAQSLQFELGGKTYANNEVLICDVDPDDLGEMKQEMQIRNLTDQPIKVLVKKEVIKSVEGTANFFCWGSCLGPDALVSPMSKEVGANAVSLEGLLSFHYQPDSNWEGTYHVGTTVVKYYAYPEDNPEDKACLEVWFAYGATSISEQSVSFSHAYPNPASSEVRFNYQLSTADVVSVSVYNLLGQEVMSQELDGMQGQAVLSVADLNDGIYFCNLMVNGQAMKTEKFIVKK